MTSATCSTEAKPPLGWRLCGLLAALLVIGVSGWGIHDPLSSMSLYTISLMGLNQAAPALLCASLPAAWWHRLERSPTACGWLLDPWIAGAAFMLASTAIGYPAILDPSIANALFAAPLGLLEFVIGTMLWAQILAARSTGPRPFGICVLAIVAGIPMTIVSVLWMTSPSVLYTPYLDVVCLWNLSPIEDQRLSGFIMLVSGIPLQLAGICKLLFP